MATSISSSSSSSSSFLSTLPSPSQTLKPQPFSPSAPSLAAALRSAAAPPLRRPVAVRAAVAIEKETPERSGRRLPPRGGPAAATSVRARFERMIREAQDEVCAALEAADGGAAFKEDVWSRPARRRHQQGAPGRRRAGVNVSVVYGMMPPEAYRAAKGEPGAADPSAKAGPVRSSLRGSARASATGHDTNCTSLPYFFCFILCNIILLGVLHPKNPFAPTLHFNYRYFETDAPADAPGAPRQWWFGGGTDLTPAYVIEEDVKHFHSHRGERRGLGGIFFDDVNDYDQEMLLGFATECAKSVIPAYLPIIQRRKDTPFTEQHKAWQQLRRGRYVEFNLVYDRGTTFGLKTGGRIESILVSLPLTARWEYDHQPEVGSEEWKLLDACINPKEWI
ncbi:Oxygen-dependent coproporphyrinogen-III oxidase, chloroplastic [Ananas comosus]|uniref:coproporphyrinogen oxidase n=1 Tax=Ananas comosus TaxID=4615 RepID=A0A199UZ48_ANACO|nr:Oxygen-dependent coproporphyrinogen-III oxidase, chloroplastic [Ananas comosus]